MVTTTRRRTLRLELIPLLLLQLLFCSLAITASPQATNVKDDDAFVYNDDDGDMASIVRGRPVEPVILGNSTNSTNATDSLAFYLSYAIPQGRFLCGAILIHPDILLSAGHCETRLYAFRNPYLWSDASNVRLGGLWRDGRDALETIKVVAEREHPKFTGRTRFPINYDFRLIKLERPSTAPIIPYNTQRSYPRAGSNVTVIGFGTTRNRGSFSRYLRYTNLTIVDFDTCNRQLFDAPDDRTMICATSDGNRRSGACQGDSGGPLFSDTGLLVGIVSWGILCGTRPRLPGVYSRVSAATDFIREGICEMSSVPPAYCASVTSSTVDNCQNCVQKGFLSLVGVQLHKTNLQGVCVERCKTIGIRAWQLLGWKCGPCPA